MPANSKKIVICFKVKNGKYQELRKIAQRDGETQTRLLQNGLDRELKSRKRRNPEIDSV